MSSEKTTAQKSNAYKIIVKINQVIFKEFMKHDGPILHGEERLSYEVLSHLSSKATRAIMNEPRLNVVLKKG